MKYIYLFFILITFSFNALSQQKSVICGKVKSDRKFIIHVFGPLNGYYNMPNIDTLSQNVVLANGKDSIHTTFNITKPTFVCIAFLDTSNYFLNRSDILLIPGDSVHVQYDLTPGNAEWAKYSGSNAAGHSVFNEINRKPFIKFQPVQSILNGLPGNLKTFTKNLNDSVGKTMLEFYKINGHENISPEYLSAMNFCFKTLDVTFVLNAFLTKNSQRNVINKVQRDSLMDVLIAQTPLVAGQFEGQLLSTLFLDSYQRFIIYKKYNLNSIDDLMGKEKAFTKNGVNYTIDKTLVPMLYVEKKWQEDLWALNLLENLQIYKGLYSEAVIDQYCLLFPDKKWESLLRTQFAQTSGISKIEYQLQSPIIYIHNDSLVNNIKTLTKLLPAGKAVFVDCWATWCGPCKAAFTFNKALDSFLLKKQIVKLYISFDNSQNRSNWKKVINEYRLGGYHILANKELQTDIKRICNIPNPEKSGIAIPRYLIINKNGAIAINDAISPHDLELLKNQITKAL